MARRTSKPTAPVAETLAEPVLPVEPVTGDEPVAVLAPEPPVVPAVQRVRLVRRAILAGVPRCTGTEAEVTPAVAARLVAAGDAVLT